MNFFFEISVGTSGTIELLNYDNNVNQDWVVDSDCSAEDGIIITAVQFNTESGYDKVTITVSGTETEYTGDLGSFEHIVDSTSFTLNFYSDGSVTRSGFEFNWQCNTDGVTVPPTTTGLCCIFGFFPPKNTPKNIKNKSKIYKK